MDDIFPCDHSANSNILYTALIETLDLNTVNKSTAHSFDPEVLRTSNSSGYLVIGLDLPGRPNFDFLFGTNSPVAYASQRKPMNETAQHETTQKNKEVAQAASFSNCTQRRRLNKPAGKTFGFFHMFGGKDPTLMETIVHEQIAMIEAANILDSIESISLVVFGPTYSTFQTPPGRKFKRSIRSNETGDERETLALLYSHCHAHPDDRVFYIHSKGSFHPSAGNDRLRRNLMKAVLYCIRNETLEDSDICGLRFAPIP